MFNRAWMIKKFLTTGSVAVTSKPSVITTVLGSCVSVCLWDVQKGIGGINHFKAPRPPRNRQNSSAYGEVAIPSLIEGMIKKGSKRSDLRAMLFGGGSVIPIIKGTDSIGADNVRFAEDTLKREGIKIVSRHTGRNYGRRVTFDTSNGTANIARISPVAAEAVIKSQGEE